MKKIRWTKSKEIAFFSLKDVFLYLIENKVISEKKGWDAIYKQELKSFKYLVSWQKEFIKNCKQDKGLVYGYEYSLILGLSDVFINWVQFQELLTFNKCLDSKIGRLINEEIDCNENRINNKWNYQESYDIFTFINL